MPGLDADDLTFDAHGAEHHAGHALAVRDQLEQALAPCPSDQAGIRLQGLPGLAALLAPDAAIGHLAATHLGPAARPVRAILFDKIAATNWSLGWHQDRTVAVCARHDVPGYGPWSTKAGIAHVEPPFAVIEAPVTLRVHLDAVPAANAPLLIAPGSHRLGRAAEPEIAGMVARSGTAACLAARGDVWLYATAILHASAASSPRHAHRRVLQIDYAATPLAPPLEWLGL